MGAPNLALFRFFKDTFSINTFIETGSGHGSTVMEATNIFPLIHTIELSKKLHAEVIKRLGERGKCYYGRSSDVLPELLPTISGPVVYWLDAHWSEGPTAGEHEQCPLLNELEIINGREQNHDFIIIDDAHVFFSPAVLKPPYNLVQWPDIGQIFDALKFKERYTIILSSWRCIKHGEPDGIVLPDDAIVSVPIWARDPFYHWLQELNLEG